MYQAQSEAQIREGRRGMKGTLVESKGPFLRAGGRVPAKLTSPMGTDESAWPKETSQCTGWGSEGGNWGANGWGRKGVADIIKNAGHIEKHHTVL